MSGDITRNTFDRKKHIRKVVEQQGRVHLDSEFNEQIEILHYYRDTSIKDIIGDSGAPSSSPGFKIQVQTAEIPRRLPPHLRPWQRYVKFRNDYNIGAGHYYVDGILCENDTQDDKPILASEQEDLPIMRITLLNWDEKSPNLKALMDFLSRNFDIELSQDKLNIRKTKELFKISDHQFEISLRVHKDKQIPLEINRKNRSISLRGIRGEDIPVNLYLDDFNGEKHVVYYDSLALPKSYGKHIVYLDVWERDISYLEEPYILEPALQGVDTTTRKKLVWQVKSLPIDDNILNDIKRKLEAKNINLNLLCDDNYFIYKKYMESELRRSKKGRLQAKVDEAVKQVTECDIPPHKGYIGLQNLL